MSRISYPSARIVKVPGATLAVNTTQYADNDLVGTLMTLNVGKSGIIQGVSLQDIDSQAAALEVYLFDVYPVNTTFTNNSALDVADADLPNCFAQFAIGASDYLAIADNSVSTTKGLAIPYQAGDGKNIYAAFRSAAATPTYTASGLSVSWLLLIDPE